MKKLCKISLCFLLMFAMMFGSISLLSHAAEVKNITISKNTTWSQDVDLFGTCNVNFGKTLTIAPGATVTIHNGASLQSWGTVKIQGKLIVEAGGHFYRSEWGQYQQVVGPLSDAYNNFTKPVLAISNGSVEISGSDFTITSGSSVRVAKSCTRTFNEHWHLAPESELAYMDNVSVNVSISGPDYSNNPTTDYARLIFGFHSGNSELFYLSKPDTFYWIYDSVNGGGKWVRFDGLSVMMATGEQQELSGDQLTWYNAFIATSRQNDPALTSDEAIILRNQVYNSSRSTRNTYNLYIPNTADKTKPISLVLCTHGGSWISGTKESMDYACAKMVRAGYVAADIDYRLFEAETDAATQMNDIMDDMTQCINTIVAQAAEMGYTIGSVATCGYSAGGHLALLYAYAHANDSCVPVSMVFELVGPAEMKPEAFAPGVMQFEQTFNAFAQKLIPGYESMTTDQRDEALAQISPLNYVNATTVPTIMAYASEDIIVGNVHGTHMDSALRNASVDYTYFVMPRSNHTCEFDSAVVDQFWETTYAYADKYLTK